MTRTTRSRHHQLLSGTTLRANSQYQRSASTAAFLYFQSGYCAVCHLPYNQLEEHCRTKKHIKLVGNEDAACISLDDSDCLDNYLFALDLETNDYCQEVSSITSRANHVKNTFFEPVTPVGKRSRNMPRTRSASVMVAKSDPMYSTLFRDTPLNNHGDSSTVYQHRLRSRKHINYMTPPLEDETTNDAELNASLHEPPTQVASAHLPSEMFAPFGRELRSSTKLLAKLTEQQTNPEADSFWDSGRPKRTTCLNSRVISADDSLMGLENRSYFKVEVLPAKLRSSQQIINTFHPHLQEQLALDRSEDRLNDTAEAEFTAPPSKRPKIMTSMTKSGSARGINGLVSHPHVPVNNNNAKTKINLTKSVNYDLETLSKCNETPIDTSRSTNTLLVPKSRLRNTELQLLNSEADNFLFPKRDPEPTRDSEESAVPNELTHVPVKAKDEAKAAIVIGDLDFKVKKAVVKVENITIDKLHPTAAPVCKKSRKPRRTHAQLFLAENQQYSIVGTPRSRLRYQGSYLPSVTNILSKVPQTKGNVDTRCTVSRERPVETEPIHNQDQVSSKVRRKRGRRKKLVVDALSTEPPSSITFYDPSASQSTDLFSSAIDESSLRFAFGRVPFHDPSFEMFRRRDSGQEHYNFCCQYSNWDQLLLPYQLSLKAKPTNWKTCVSQYEELLKLLSIRVQIENRNMSRDALLNCNGPLSVASTSSSCSSTIDGDFGCGFLTEGSTAPSPIPPHENSISDLECTKLNVKPSCKRSKTSKNARKSPRQHASTLAILSGFFTKERVRKPRLTGNSPHAAAKSRRRLPPIKEEEDLSSTTPASVTNQISAIDPVRCIELANQPLVVRKTATKTNESSELTSTVRVNKVRNLDYLKAIRQQEEWFNSLREDDDIFEIVSSSIQKELPSPDQEASLDDLLIDWRHVKSELIKRGQSADLVYSTAFKGCISAVDQKKRGRKVGRKRKNLTGWPNPSRMRIRIKRAGHRTPNRMVSRPPVVGFENSCDANNEESVVDTATTPGISSVDNAPAQVSTPPKNQSNERFPNNCKVPATPLSYNTVLKRRAGRKRKRKISTKQLNTTPKKKLGRKRKRISVQNSPKSPKFLRKPRGRWYKER